MRRIVLPGADELDSDLSMDASGEITNTKVRGLQHKYANTALLLVNDFCAAYCRVLLSQALHALDRRHVKIIRIGTKVPAFDPARITSEMISVLSEASEAHQRVYLMLHYNHPRELTKQSLATVTAAQQAGLKTLNQTPILRGVNDDVATLVSLLKSLTDAGITPYYLFHCRPTMGDESFMLTLQEGEELVGLVRRELSGLARGFRYVGSHQEGKVEILGHLDDQLVFRFHEARDKNNDGRVMTWPIDKPIYWFDDVVAQAAELDHQLR